MMASSDRATQRTHSSQRSIRLHYLDWLRVLATLGVFLYHAMRPFDVVDWHVKNAEQSEVVTLIFVIFLGSWGMPLFFLVSGASSWFALHRRTGGQYAVERIKRLLTPFIVGSILLSPIQAYIEWIHNTRTGAFGGSFMESLGSRFSVLGPRAFLAIGHHLWFLGYLCAYSLLALPLFLWLKKEACGRFIAWLGELSERRGGLLAFILPLALVRFVLQPAYPEYTNWADFIFYLVFFISGYILFADHRFARAIQRDWPLALIAGIISTLIIVAALLAGLGLEWSETPGTPGFLLAWTIVSMSGWCWTIFTLYVGMRFLDFSNSWLRYGQEAILPFYLFHHPVIISIALFVVQWEAGIVVKLPVVVFGSFVATLGLYEFVIRRMKPLRSLFGMKAPRRQGSEVGTR